MRDIIPDRSTVLDFYQMAPPSGSVVPFVLVYSADPINLFQLYHQSVKEEKEDSWRHFYYTSNNRSVFLSRPLTATLSNSHWTCATTGWLSV